MRWLIASILTLILIAALPHCATACPMCGEISEKSASSEDDPMREARAYATSIYLFLGVPALSLAGFGFVVHRELRKRGKPPTV